MVTEEQKNDLRAAAKKADRFVFKRINEEIFVTRRAKPGVSVQGVLIDAKGRLVSLEHRKFISYDFALKLLQ